MSRQRNSNLFILAVFFGFFALCLTAAVPDITNTYSSLFDRYEVTGTVEAPPTSKMRISGGEGVVSGSEKYAVRIDGTIYNCTNTQCSQLAVGRGGSPPRLHRRRPGDQPHGRLRCASKERGAYPSRSRPLGHTLN